MSLYWQFYAVSMAFLIAACALTGSTGFAAGAAAGIGLIFLVLALKHWND